MMRRLDPIEDEGLLREAYEWGREARWFREVEDKFGDKSVDEFINRAKSENQADIGLFENEMVCLITLEFHGAGVYEAHIRAKRGTDFTGTAQMARFLKSQLFRNLGAKEIFGQIPSFNRGAIKLAEMCGLYRDGITVIQGQIRNRLIEWVRVSAGE